MLNAKKIVAMGMLLGLAVAGMARGADAAAPIVVNDAAEPVKAGKFKPTWESLGQYSVPEWYRDAKFGIWAHWGPQCAPEAGDWYARNMYIQGSRQYPTHLQLYGHPSQFGFKDVIHTWKAEAFDPDRLMALYKRAGAQYFFAMANHHDNLDLWDSKYQEWNTVRVGPQKDLIAGWEKAARGQGLKFGVSIHAARAWSWYEVAQGADKTGPQAGVPYDGKLTKADGKGTWWEGLDPQELYEQRHPKNPKGINGRLPAAGDPSGPDERYCEKFYNRVSDLVTKYKPDMIYFDDTALPLWPISDAGLKIAASFYNFTLDRTGGKDQGLIFGKLLTPEQKHCLTLDIERGASSTIEPDPWQTDTCIGDWHYSKARLANHNYKSAVTVIRTLCDIVSKNGNLLLSVPVRSDGSIDADEEAIVTGIGDWMAVNGEAIFGTRPWKTCGEGPQLEALAASTQPTGGNFNEGRGKPFSPADIRYTTKGNVIYAFVMGKPEKDVQLTSLALKAGLLQGRITKVEQLGVGAVKFEVGEEKVTLTPDVSKVTDRHQTVVFKIETGP